MSMLPCFRAFNELPQLYGFGVMTTHRHHYDEETSLTSNLRLRRVEDPPKGLTEQVSFFCNGNCD